jgi:hypothetical protein
MATAELTAGTDANCLMQEFEEPLPQFSEWLEAMEGQDRVAMFRKAAEATSMYYEETRLRDLLFKILERPAIQAMINAVETEEEYNYCMRKIERALTIEGNRLSIRGKIINLGLHLIDRFD